MKTDNEIQTFCRNIYLLRRKNHLTQKQMAQKLGISLYALREIESGRLPNSVTVHILFHIARHFGLRPSRVFSPELFP